VNIFRRLILLCLYGAAAASISFAQPVANPSGDDQFAFDLYARHAVDAGNVFYSPYSMSTALSMVYEGARGGTADEMRTVLHLSTDDAARRAGILQDIMTINAPGKAYALDTANALWAQKDFAFQDAYVQLVRQVYSGEARELDFINAAEPSRITINGWVAQQTRDKIRDLIPPKGVDASTRLVITNAVYFKGAWEETFSKKLTRPEDFWTTPERAVKAELMSQEHDFDYMENDLVQMIDLPYEGGDLSMVVVLPRKNDPALIAGGLQPEAFKQWQSGLHGEKVKLYFPKFKFSADYEFKDDLRALGMAAAFDAGAADFSGMTGTRDLYISQVFHKAWIEVNEEGTEAAAATAVVMALNGMPTRPEEPKVFRADHPFFFVIQDNSTGRILFMGRVSDPTAQ
jgi:serpin B